MDPRLRRWAALARTAALGWAARLPGLVLCLTSLTIGQTQKQINLLEMMTVGKQLRDIKHGVYR